MGVASVLAGTGVARLAGLVSGVRLAGSVRTMATTLRLARGRALAGGAGIEVRFDATGRRYETRDRAGTLLAAQSLGPGVRFLSLPARGRILFGALGTAENGTVTLGAGTSARSVVVNQRGRVRLS